MNPLLVAWNNADENEALIAMLACCSAPRWARAMVALRPLASTDEMKVAADRVWASMAEPDWLEAFACHPRIGERKAANAADSSPGQSAAQYAAWSKQEQSSRQQPQQRAHWPRLPQATRNTNSSSASRTSSAPTGKKHGRDACNPFSAASQATAQPNCARRRTTTTDHADSTCKMVGGITTKSGR